MDENESQINQRIANQKRELENILITETFLNSDIVFKYYYVTHESPREARPAISR